MVLCLLFQRWFVLITLFASPAGAAQCTACASGTAMPTSTYSLPFSIPGIDTVKNCGHLEILAPAVLADSAECLGIQQLTTYCGCPLPTDKDVCTLCPDESRVPEDYLQTVTTYKMELEPTCGLVEATLHTSELQLSTECEQAQASQAATCGCPGVTPAPTNSNVKRTPPPVPAPTPQVAARCTVCHDGGPMDFPTKDITGPLREAGYLEQIQALGLNTSCSSVATLIPAIEADTSDCIGAQQFLGGICGCAHIDGYCTMCPNDNGTIPHPTRYMNAIYYQAGINVTCEEFNLTLMQFREGGDACFAGQHYNYLCGCNDGNRHYSGANTDTKRIALSWVPRCTGFVSFLCSLFIIRDIFRDKKKRVSSYHQIIFGLSSFDCISSLTWVVGTAVVPEYQWGQETGIEGAYGNQLTCEISGFFMQLGLFGSTGYNFALSVYYVLVIVNSVPEFKIKTLRKYFHIPPIVIALAFGGAGIPFYDNLIMICHVPPYPEDEKYLVYVLVVVPILLALAGCMLNMARIYWTVRKQSHASRKWTMSGAISSRTPNDDRNNNSNNHGPPTLDRVVFWQAIFYVASFTITWPFWIVSLLRFETTSYVYFIFVATMVPLQGAFNFIVYMRPRWGQRVLQNQRLRQAARSKKSSESHSIPKKPSEQVSRHLEPVDQEQEGCEDEYRRTEMETTETTDTRNPPSVKAVEEEEEKKAGEADFEAQGTTSQDIASVSEAEAAAAEKALLPTEPSASSSEVNPMSNEPQEQSSVLQQRAEDYVSSDNQEQEQQKEGEDKVLSLV
mmetsp:Transcript_7708/g.21467  ORF Transcript_7708/g.21467 Transcript_7708/m.21467 type:complete len:788 (-) Transcript_7708:202-2565(-)